MAKQTLQEIQAQVARLKSQAAELERQAAELRAQEVAGVIERIREAISVYGLTELDIFSRRIKSATTAANRRARTAKLRSGVIRFKDEAGNTWTGRGKRPNWFKAAIASGTNVEDLAVG